MKRRNIFYMVFIAVILAGAALGAVSYIMAQGDDADGQEQDDLEPIIEKISIHTANEMILGNSTNSGFYILDVRTPEEYEDGRLADSINIDFYAETFRDELNKLDRVGTYVIYCRSGNRSGQTLGIMKELEFMEVYDFGSFFEWKDSSNISPYGRNVASIVKL